MTNGFYFPRTKMELVDFLIKHYPSDKTKFKKMRVEQLRAIRLEIIKRHLTKS